MIIFKGKQYNIIGLNMPESCPSCGSDIIVQDNGQVRCSNTKCPELIRHKVSKFFDVIDIKGAGDAFLLKCSSEVDGLSSLLEKATSDCSKEIFENWAGGVNGSKILNALIKKLSEPITISKFLALMDLEGFGEKKLALFEETDLFQNVYKNPSEIESLVKGFSTLKEIISLKGMGDDIKVELGEMLLSDCDDIINSSKYFTFKNKENNMENGRLNGHSFCFHGTLSEKRSVLEQLVKDNGGKIGGVNKSLNYLVCNDQTSGTKVATAKKLGIPMITEDEFRDLLK